jgi:hypothetical protein
LQTSVARLRQPLAAARPFHAPCLQQPLLPLLLLLLPKLLLPRR